MSKFDILQHSLDRTNPLFEDLNGDYKLFVEALRDKDWIKAERLQKQVRATTDSLLTSMFSGFVLASPLEEDQPNGH